MILPAQKRIVVIGDLHGDLFATFFILKKAKLIEIEQVDNYADIKWIGGSTYVVQIGDQIDRAPRELDTCDHDENSDLKIISLFDNLDELAKNHGGRVISILGNHEIMNVMGNFDYVSNMGQFMERKQLFKRGGFVCKNYFSKRPAVCKIGSWFFCHGGMTPKISKKYSINEINKLMHDFLDGDKPQNIIKFNEIFMNPDSILWNRQLSMDPPKYNIVKPLLKALDAKHIVMGHTPYRDIGINQRSKGKIWRVDCGLSRAFGNHHNPSEMQYLEILDDGKQVRIVK